MNLEILKKELQDYPDYRLRQAKKAVYKNLINSWDNATDLPQEIRKKLSERVDLLIDGELIYSKDKKTAKAKIKLEDGFEIETVFMDYGSYGTVCLSTQVGCSLGCQFCSTGKMGFHRDLEYFEIVNQLLFLKRKLKKREIKNVVFMGMGEPFLNYQNLFEAIKIINHPDYFNIGARNISISTVGIPDGIKKMANEKMQINLAVSLHFSSDQKRSQYMPINKKYPLKELLESVDFYIKKSNRKVMFEYLLLEKINDMEVDAINLVKILKNRLSSLNLIEYNQTGNLKGSSFERIENFKKILKNHKINVTQRKSFGKEIKGACGQLITKNEKKDICNS